VPSRLPTLARGAHASMSACLWLAGRCRLKAALLARRSLGPCLAFTLNYLLGAHVPGHGCHAMSRTGSVEVRTRRRREASPSVDVAHDLAVPDATTDLSIRMNIEHGLASRSGASRHLIS
jgi:hypothetical protein